MCCNQLFTDLQTERAPKAKQRALKEVPISWCDSPGGSTRSVNESLCPCKCGHWKWASDTPVVLVMPSKDTLNFVRDVLAETFLLNLLCSFMAPCL